MTAKDYHAAWYLANRDREREKNREWYRTHRDEHRANCAARYARNRALAQAKNRAWSRTAAGMLAAIRTRAKRRGK